MPNYNVFDVTDKLGQLGSGAEWPMYSFDRAAYEFWNGFAQELEQRGFTEGQIKDVLQSKAVRHFLDQHDDAINKVGKSLATRFASDQQWIGEFQ